jgi:predicted regulator of Ras-like GTPase activity (Roadblock/LC7/MglB family)
MSDPVVLSRESSAVIARTVHEVQGVERVVVCRHDGVALWDDEVLERRTAGAASVAAILGMARVASEALGLSGNRGVVLHGGSSRALVTWWDSQHVVAVVVRPETRLGLVRKALAQAQVELLTES